MASGQAQLDRGRVLPILPFCFFVFFQKKKEKKRDAQEWEVSDFRAGKLNLGGAGTVGQSRVLFILLFFFQFFFFFSEKIKNTKTIKKKDAQEWEVSDFRAGKLNLGGAGTVGQSRVPLHPSLFHFVHFVFFKIKKLKKKSKKDRGLCRRIEQWSWLSTSEEHNKYRADLFFSFLWRKQQQQRNNSSWWRRTKQLGIKRLFELYLMKVDAVHVGHRAWSKQKAQSAGVYFYILFPSKQFWRAQMDAGVNWADHRLNSQYHDILSIHGRKQNRKE